MRKPELISSSEIVEGDLGDLIIKYRIFRTNEEATDDEIDAWVSEQFPRVGCQHAHDCCGRFYPLRGQWSKLQTYGHVEFIVRQMWIQNI